MQAYLTLARRELAGYFLSLTGYVIMAATLFLVGLSFVALLEVLQREPTSMPVTELFHVTWYFLFILMLPAPVITMRLFALEKFSGTFETLMTAPVRDFEVVLAKFSAALIFYVVMASALTRSQVIAAMISLAFGLSFFLLAYLADQTPARPGWATQALACFALFDQMRDFARGVIDTRAVILYGTLTLFFLFLTLRIVESRRWK